MLATFDDPPVGTCTAPVRFLSADLVAAAAAGDTGPDQGSSDTTT
jgi:hypothetical protein